MNKNNNGAVIVFVKAPVKGAVKTRLAATIGDAQALVLYQCFVADVLDMLRTTGQAIRIYFHPAEDRERVRDWLGEDLPLSPQTGASLGERMKNTLAETFAAGFSRALVIGSDLPDLPAAVINEAVDLLRDQAPVIGPAQDGGYYLIGFTAAGFLPDVFDGIAWGTETVLAETLRRFHEHGITPRLLAVWRDIDTVDDLEALSRETKDSAGSAVHTRDCLRNITVNKGNV